MRGSLLALSFVFFNGLLAGAQNPLEPVKGLPTREVYDLHVDKKGYLWIAHGLGLSRYDGLNFIHFNHSSLATLRMMDIVEDPMGRIWCHNFSGQVFYIDRGQIHILQEYDYKKESQFPRMALCGDELLITSEHGLFICSTVTLRSRFIPFRQKSHMAGQVSIAVLGRKAVLYNNANWYLYQQGYGMKEIAVDPAIQLTKGNTISLQPATFKDTLFLTSNPAGMLQQLLLQRDSVKLVSRTEYHDYINAVTIANGKAWVHNHTRSTTTDESLVIKNYNLTSIVTGKEGNTWYSSLKEGLMVSYRPSNWKKMNWLTDKDDYIRSLNVSDGYFFAGTQKGYLLVLEPENGKLKWKYNLFNGYGSIDFIRYFQNHRFIVGTSTNTFVVYPRKKEIKELLPIEAVVDVDYDDNTLYLATPNGFYMQPYLEGEPLSAWKSEKRRQYPFYHWDSAGTPPYLTGPQRSGAVRYDNGQQLLYVSTKDGLRQVTSKGLQPFYIMGKEVFASSLWYQFPRLYIATINDGLWVKEGNDLKHFTTADYLFSNTIVRIKVTGTLLWLLEDTGIQVFDTRSNRVLQHIGLPKIVGADVWDVAEKDSIAYLTTAEGIYKVPMQVSIEKRAPDGYLDYALVTNKDTLYTGDVRLPYDKNDIQFFFSSPAFYSPEAISFKYRLLGADTAWQLTKPNERMLRFSSLEPGDYTFEALAVNRDGLQQAAPVTFSFAILTPWWNHWWFIALLNLLVFAVVYIIIRNRITQKLRIELIRRHIASDLHDDIGATLSSINIYTELAQDELGANEHLTRIQQHINDVVTRLDDLVWSINPKNDTMEQLLNRMRHVSGPLLAAAGIQCHFEYDKKFLDLKLNLANKQNVYLLFKEMVNNVVKHARCRHCYIHIHYEHPFITLSVKDDGIGFNPDAVPKHRNGLQNLQHRAAKMNGSLWVHSSSGGGTTVVVQVKAS